MAFISLDEAKQQLQLESDETEHDTVLNAIIADVESIVSNDIQKVVYATQAALDAESNPPSNAVVLDGAIRRACLLLIGHFFNNREATSERTIKTLPLAYEHCLCKHLPDPNFG